MTAREYAQQQGITLEAARKRLQRARRDGQFTDSSSPGHDELGEGWTKRDELPGADADIECAGCAAMRERIRELDAEIAEMQYRVKAAEVACERQGAQDFEIAQLQSRLGAAEESLGALHVLAERLAQIEITRASAPAQPAPVWPPAQPANVRANGRVLMRGDFDQSAGIWE